MKSSNSSSSSSRSSSWNFVGDSVEICCSWGAETVREPRGSGTSAVGSRYQRTGEDSRLRRLKCLLKWTSKLWRTVRAYSLLAVTSCRYSIIPIASVQSLHICGNNYLCNEWTAVTDIHQSRLKTIRNFKFIELSRVSVTSNHVLSNEKIWKARARKHLSALDWFNSGHVTIFCTAQVTTTRRFEWIWE
jgi:hypothetical protein